MIKYYISFIFQVLGEIILSGNQFSKKFVQTLDLAQIRVFKMVKTNHSSREYIMWQEKKIQIKIALLNLSIIAIKIASKKSNWIYS